MIKFVKSAEYVAHVHHELLALLTDELKQHVLNPIIIPTHFAIRYDRIINTDIIVKFTLINGSMGHRLSLAHMNKKPAQLHYAFKIMSSVELATGSFKVRVISETTRTE